MKKQINFVIGFVAVLVIVEVTIVITFGVKLLEILGRLVP
jgi:hypothetical protein